MSSVKMEDIKKVERYLQRPDINRDYIKKAIDDVLKKIDENLEYFTDKFPGPSSVNNVYPPITTEDWKDNDDWTSSFWTGMLWLAYEITGDEKYRKVADLQVKLFKKRIEDKVGVRHHDLGFLYSISCVAAYKLTGSEEAKEAALMAAEHLTTRYLDKAGIIQAWGDLNNPEQQGRMIIDCCMNLPLLYWASEVTGDPKYHDMAYSHAMQASKYIVREDASTYHTYYMNVETGEPRFGRTHQGYSDDSCWARGQAWGIYGFPLTHKYEKNYELIELAKKIANYFINRLPEDEVCYWDLLFTEGNEQERDSSAAAIAACGLLELLKSLPLMDEYKTIYENVVLKMLKSLNENYTYKQDPKSNGILLHAVYAKPQGRGVDECCIWGDYYYFEALVRVYKDWQLYW